MQKSKENKVCFYFPDEPGQDFCQENLGTNKIRLFSQHNSGLVCGKV